ncbi:MAG TPA: hypothetical protein VIL36_01140 [Acidimicrobiales bacterium]
MFRLVYSAVLGVTGVAIGAVVALAMGQIQGLALACLGVVALFVAVWTPHRVTLDDTGVVLQAVARRVHIPWDDLASVAPPWWDVRHELLKWRRRRGLGVLTLQAFPELHRLLVEVEQRSPGTSVAS